MNTIPETITTAFAPETAFVLSLRPADQQDDELPAHFEMKRPVYQNREWRGIPDSALND